MDKTILISQITTSSTEVADHFGDSFKLENDNSLPSLLKPYSLVSNIGSSSLKHLYSFLTDISSIEEQIDSFGEILLLYISLKKSDNSSHIFFFIKGVDKMIKGIDVLFATMLLHLNKYVISFVA